VDQVNPNCAIPLALYADPGAAQSGERPISAEHQSWVQKLKALGLKHRSGASQTVPGDKMTGERPLTKLNGQLSVNLRLVGVPVPPAHGQTADGAG